MQQPIFDGFVVVSAVTREFVFVFYLHRERCGLLVRLSQLVRKRTPLPNNLASGNHLVHFGAFTFSLRSTSRSLYSEPIQRLFLRGREGNGVSPALRTQPALLSHMGFVSAAAGCRRAS